MTTYSIVTTRRRRARSAPTFAPLRERVRIAVIVPARNEARTVGDVLAVAASSDLIDELVLVDDGSSDATAEVGRRYCTVLSLPSSIGKAGAMALGVAATSADIIVFLDADLLGLRAEHLQQLLDPVVSGEAEMVIGERDCWWYRLPIGRRIVLRLGGERALTRELWDATPDRFKHGFRIEAGINAVARVGGARRTTVPLNGVRHVRKETKQGFRAGVRARARMARDVAEAYTLVSQLTMVTGLRWLVTP